MRNGARKTPATPRLAAALLAACVGLLALPALASAAAFLVDTTADAAPSPTACEGSNGCSLRQAIGKADSAAGADTVVLPAGHYALTLQGAEEDEDESGDLDIAEGSDLVVSGAGARSTIIDATGLGERVFDVLPQSSLFLSGVTVTGGHSEADGGGIHAAEATLNLDRVSVSRNEAIESGYGGGLSLTATNTTITNSLIAENRNSGDGGGLHFQGGRLSIVNSTIADNVVDTILNQSDEGWGAYGGAMEIESGALKLENVTIAGNSIRDGNGGEEGAGTAIYGAPDESEIVNTIVYGNTGTEVGLFAPGQCTFTLESQGHNLQGQPPTEEPPCFEDPTDLIADPLLGALADNGGETDTLALQEGSPAVDVGDGSSCPAIDQRDVPRPQLGGCDIGAFELQPAPPAPTPTPVVPPVAAAPSPAPQVPAAKPRLRRHGKPSVRSRARTFVVATGFTLSCPPAGRCEGTIVARVKKAAIGRTSFDVAPGKTKRLSLQLNRSGAKLLRRKHRVVARFQVTARAGSGPVARAKAQLALKLPRRHRR